MANKRADMGIGTLILFIAMLIVASITANVLVQTAQSMQSSALSTGEQARKAISTVLETNMVTGINVTDNKINDIRMDIKLGPGSEPVNLEQALLSVDTSSSGYDYRYSDGDCERNQSGYIVDPDNNNGTFTARYILRGPSSDDGIVASGDRIELCFALGEGLQSNRHMDIRLEPQVGMSNDVSFSAPNVITSDRVRLYP